MHNHKLPRRAEIVTLVISELHNLLSQEDEPLLDNVGEDTALIGRRSVLDSIGLVTLIIDLEQRLEEQYSISLALADDRAMSQKNSPFLTVQSLTDYICSLIEEVR
jgi:acyl carrier protein